MIPLLQTRFLKSEVCCARRQAFEGAKPLRRCGAIANRTVGFVEPKRAALRTSRERGRNAVADARSDDVPTKNTPLELGEPERGRSESLYDGRGRARLGKTRRSASSAGKSNGSTLSRHETTADGWMTRSGRTPARSVDRYRCASACETRSAASFRTKPQPDQVK